MKKRYIIVALLSALPHAQATIFPLNIFQPFDPNVYRPTRWENSFTDVSVMGEFGIKTEGYSSCPQPCDPPKQGCKVNVLQVWNREQNGLAMLKGFNPESRIGALAQQINIDVDNGVRGHFTFCGDLDVLANIIISNRYYLPYGLIFGAHLPIVSLKLDVCFTDLTQQITADDFLTKQLLTDHFAQNVCELGGLNICGWRNTGLGDLALMLDWVWNFPQSKPLLKNVHTKTHFGFSIPTGKKTQLDQIMSIPLGNDGAFGFLFGGGLDLLLGTHCQVGVDVLFLGLLATTAQRRIKTALDQTELLLLAKTEAVRDYGITTRFNLYVQAFNLWDRLSGTFTYQFFKHSDDRLSLVNNEFSTEIANSALSLEEYTMHNFVYALSYDFEHTLKPDSRIKPYMSLFYKQGINGKNAFIVSTWGFVFALSF